MASGPRVNEKHMREAIALSREGMEKGEGGPFGAVIVKDGSVVGRGFNGVVGGPDPTAHAEIQAIRDASAALSRFDLRGCVIYSSCEPCPMCWAAIHWARLDRLFFAASREDAAAVGFDDGLIARHLGQTGTPTGLPVARLLREEAWAVMQDWQSRPDRQEY